MSRMEGNSQEVASLRLCLELCSYIQDFNGIYAQLRNTPSKEWPSLVERNFSRLFSKHHEFIRLGEIVSSHNSFFNQGHMNISTAISAGTVARLKAERNNAFEDMRQRSVFLSQEPNSEHYPIVKLKEENLKELSYLIPGEDGWILAYSSEQIQFFLSTEQFGIVLEVPGADDVNYGIYKACRLQGQSMSGLEFSQLSESTKIRIARALSQSEKGDPMFNNTMDGLLHSLIVLSCIFLQCVQKPAVIKENIAEVYNTRIPTRSSFSASELSPIRPPWGVIGDRQQVRRRSMEDIFTKGSTPQIRTPVQGQYNQADKLALESPSPLRPITNGQARWPLINYGTATNDISTPKKNAPGLMDGTVRRADDEENRPYSAPATDPSLWNGCRLRRIMDSATPFSEASRSSLGWTQSEDGHSAHW
ncbi:hypothetical protein GALMADRAFT_135331 [Galerina marginata CBS 339.88]|uniref:Uncharacterized protein n=1 Tax=Galerina marginata (strain CBS 339.88) TaxID=685588 RepID=A0A067TFQ9_GALM3|nr:hypothetical protein GALMADRAFT_135331 [Galerina marginata CBS 339.88]